MTAASPAPAPQPVAEAATPRGLALLDALAIDTRAAPGVRRFVILDGARDPSIHAALERHDPERTCLFSGDLPTVLEAAAPWLVDVDAAPPACVSWLVDEVWGTSAGVWLVAEASLGELRKHLRRFLRVKGPSGAKLMFRSYDPRVLRLFLEVVTPEQVPFFFGSIVEWSVEDEEPDALLRFHLGEAGLVRARVALSAPPPPAPAAAPAPPPPASVDLSGSPELVAGRLRTALGEQPGAQRLVVAAADVARSLDPTERARADALRAALEAQRANLGPSAVAATLRAAKPAPDPSWERPYLALLPGAQGWLTGAERARLRASCAAVREATEVVVRAEVLRQETRDLPEGAAGEEAAGRILEELRQHHLRAQAWAEAGDPQLEPVVSHLKRLMTRLELRKTVDGRAVGTGLASLLMSLKAHGSGGEREVDRVRAEALEAALRCTAASDAPAEGAAKRAAPAPARKGRVPPRPSAAAPADLELPGRERDRASFVVSHAQLAALAAAGDRALQTALERHALERHTARAEVLAERLAPLAARCRAKAARYGIQRRASVLRLFDLMLVHDPEFEGLARFDWAAALLENDLVDPDAKPDMIHARAAALRPAPSKDPS